MNSHDLSPPDSIARLLPVLGEETTVELLLEFGGTEVVLPTSASSRNELTRLVGPEKAMALAEAHEELKLRLPMPKRWLARALRNRGLSHADIARKLKCADITVRRYLKDGGEIRRDPRQLPLF